MKGYLEASNFACDEIEKRMDARKLEFPEWTFAQAISDSELGIDMLVKEGGVEYYKIPDHISDSLVTFSLRDSLFYDLFIDICTCNILKNRPLPISLRKFCADVLNGNIKRPTPKNRPRKKDFLEKAFFYLLVRVVSMDFNLPVTRNDEIAQDRTRHSASDVVANALSICGRPTMYSEIKNLMTHPDHKRLRKEIMVAVLLRADFLKSLGSSQNDPAEITTAHSEISNRFRKDILDTFPNQPKKSA